MVVFYRVFIIFSIKLLFFILDYFIVYKEYCLFKYSEQNRDSDVDAAISRIGPAGCCWMQRSQKLSSGPATCATDSGFPAPLRNRSEQRDRSR